MNIITSMAQKPYTLLLRPIKNALMEILCLIGENSKDLARYLTAIILAFLIVSSLGYYTLAIRSLTWILLGVASSIGFGFGMHTFVLFLAPHIAAVTMAAHSCNSLDFPEPPYPKEIICPDQRDDLEVTFLRILQKVGLEAFMWGLGTAIGELPPYLGARLRARAMGRRVGGDVLGPGDQAAGWEAWMIKIINKIGFTGILMCAAIPNPLFDAAGLASGMAQIPFLSFFGATLIGKAIIKMLIQTSFVILSFHNNNLESFVLKLNTKVGELFPSVKDLKLDRTLTVFLDEQRNNVLEKRMGEHKPASTISTLFNWIIFGCCVLFFLSLINALDKQYRERITRKNTSKQVRRTE